MAIKMTHLISVFLWLLLQKLISSCDSYNLVGDITYTDDNDLRLFTNYEDHCEYINHNNKVAIRLDNLIQKDCLNRTINFVNTLFNYWEKFKLSSEVPIVWQIHFISNFLTKFAISKPIFAKTDIYFTWEYFNNHKIHQGHTEKLLKFHNIYIQKLYQRGSIFDLMGLKYSISIFYDKIQQITLFYTSNSEDLKFLKHYIGWLNLSYKIIDKIYELYKEKVFVGLLWIKSGYSYNFTHEKYETYEALKYLSKSINDVITVTRIFFNKNIKIHLELMKIVENLDHLVIGISLANRFFKIFFYNEKDVKDNEMNNVEYFFSLMYSLSDHYNYTDDEYLQFIDDYFLEFPSINMDEYIFETDDPEKYSSTEDIVIMDLTEDTQFNETNDNIQKCRDFKICKKISLPRNGNFIVPEYMKDLPCLLIEKSIQVYSKHYNYDLDSSGNISRLTLQKEKDFLTYMLACLPIKKIKNPHKVILDNICLKISERIKKITKYNAFLNILTLFHNLIFYNPRFDIDHHCSFCIGPILQIFSVLINEIDDILRPNYANSLEYKYLFQNTKEICTHIIKVIFIDYIYLGRVLDGSKENLNSKIDDLKKKIEKLKNTVGSLNISSIISVVSSKQQKIQISKMLYKLRTCTFVLLKFIFILNYVLNIDLSNTNVSARLYSTLYSYIFNTLYVYSSDDSAVDDFIKYYFSPKVLSPFSIQSYAILQYSSTIHGEVTNVDSNLFREDFLKAISICDIIQKVAYFNYVVPEKINEIVTLFLYEIEDYSDEFLKEDVIFKVIDRYENIDNSIDLWFPCIITELITNSSNEKEESLTSSYTHITNANLGNKKLLYNKKVYEILKQEDLAFKENPERISMIFKSHIAINKIPNIKDESRLMFMNSNKDFHKGNGGSLTNDSMAKVILKVDQIDISLEFSKVPPAKKDFISHIKNISVNEIFIAWLKEVNKVGDKKNGKIFVNSVLNSEEACKTVKIHFFDIILQYLEEINKDIIFRWCDKSFEDVINIFKLQLDQNNKNINEDVSDKTLQEYLNEIVDNRNIIPNHCSSKDNKAILKKWGRCRSNLFKKLNKLQNQSVMTNLIKNYNGVDEEIKESSEADLNILSKDSTGNNTLQNTSIKLKKKKLKNRRKNLLRNIMNGKSSIKDGKCDNNENENVGKETENNYEYNPESNNSNIYVDIKNTSTKNKVESKKEDIKNDTTTSKVYQNEVQLKKSNYIKPSKNQSEFKIKNRIIIVGDEDKDLFPELLINISGNKDNKNTPEESNDILRIGGLKTQKHKHFESKQPQRLFKNKELTPKNTNKKKFREYKDEFVEENRSASKSNKKSVILKNKDTSTNELNVNQASKIEINSPLITEIVDFENYIDTSQNNVSTKIADNKYKSDLISSTELIKINSVKSSHNEISMPQKNDKNSGRVLSNHNIPINYEECTTTSTKNTTNERYYTENFKNLNEVFIEPELYAKNLSIIQLDKRHQKNLNLSSPSTNSSNFKVGSNGNAVNSTSSSNQSQSSLSPTSNTLGNCFGNKFNNGNYNKFESNEIIINEALFQYSNNSFQDRNFLATNNSINTEAASLMTHLNLQEKNEMGVVSQAQSNFSQIYPIRQLRELNNQFESNNFYLPIIGNNAQTCCANNSISIGSDLNRNYNKYQYGFEKDCSNCTKDTQLCHESNYNFGENRTSETIRPYNKDISIYSRGLNFTHGFSEQIRNHSHSYDNGSMYDPIYSTSSLSKRTEDLDLELNPITKSLQKFINSNKGSNLFSEITECENQINDLSLIPDIYQLPVDQFHEIQYKLSSTSSASSSLNSSFWHYNHINQ